jgi:PhnB protein
MKGCALLIEEPDTDRAAALFAALSAGGRITVPFTRQFWGDDYGNFTDRFGVQWAVNSVPQG